ncbi:uncharacterized protein TNCV_2642361 [Trichonephila clavipes]|nr:uncharacterized protein TNCV_2642361 [Trichonephila clavipes]
MSAADIRRQIIEVNGTEAISDSKVRNWVGKYKDGRTNVHDEVRSGRPSVITTNLMQAVEIKIHENGRFTINYSFIGISRRFSVGSVQNCVNEDLNFKKLCSRWVPRILTTEHKGKRFAISLGILEVGDGMMNRILTGDET